MSNNELSWIREMQEVWVLLIERHRKECPHCGSYVQNKDLIDDTSIHDDLVKEGLLEQRPHALVIMYANVVGLVRENSYSICIREAARLPHGLP